MADTSPFPEKPKHEVPGAHKPANHKKLVVVIVIIIAIGLLALLYGAYSSRRSHADGTTDQVTQKTSSPSQASTQDTVHSTVKAGTETVPVSNSPTQANQTVTLKLYANSGNQSVNTVQAVIDYPKAGLQLVSVDGTGSAFPNEVATDKSAAGVVKLARAVSSQAQSVQGEQLVATLTFKSLGSVDVGKQVTVDVDDSYLVTSTDNRNLLASDDGTLMLR